MRIDETIVHWAAQWIVYYESWVQTGIWQGGGHGNWDAPKDTPSKCDQLLKAANQKEGVPYPLLMLWKHISKLYSPARLFLRAVPVGKFTIGTTTAYTDAASAASSKE